MLYAKASRSMDKRGPVEIGTLKPPVKTTSVWGDPSVQQPQDKGLSVNTVSGWSEQSTMLPSSVGSHGGEASEGILHACQGDLGSSVQFLVRGDLMQESLRYFFTRLLSRLKFVLSHQGYNDDGALCEAYRLLTPKGKRLALPPSGYQWVTHLP